MWWIGLFFEHLALDLIRDDFSNSPREPGVDAAIALCDRESILDIDDRARAHGVEIGMKRATALALLPSLRLLERNPGAERHALESIALWMQQFTPATSLQPCPGSIPRRASTGASTGATPDATPAPCGLVAEVAPSLRYFGGLRALCTRVREGLHALGYRVRIGVAPTAGAAWLLARHRDASFASPEQLEERIGALPAQLLAYTRAQRELLQAIGVQQVHELLALPRAAIARRFGPAWLDELDQALGRRPEPRQWFTAPPVFHQRLELFGRIEHARALCLAAQRLLASMTGWLRARGGAIRAFTLHIEHEDCAETRIDIGLADPTNDDSRMSSLLRERLAVTRLPEAARALRLQAGEIVALPGASAGLFPSPRSADEELHRLIERLQARLGAGHVRRVRVIADDRPEAAWRFETIDAAMPAGRHGEPASPLPTARLPRPLWLLDPPLPLSERNHRPWWRSALQLQAGPERIESGWWDGRLVQRDYFIATDEAHLLYWIYRERLETDENHAWFLHGRFG